VHIVSTQQRAMVLNILFIHIFIRQGMKPLAYYLSAYINRLEQLHRLQVTEK